MNQKITIIETPSLLEREIGVLYNSKPKGVDTETEGLDPLTDKLRLLQLSDDENTLVIDTRKVGYEATSHYLKPIFLDNDVPKLFHNAKFDLKFIRHYLGLDVNRIFDSFLASIIMQGGIRMEKGFHGLEKTLKRHTGLDISKEEQRSDWSGEISTKQFQYAAKDAQVLLPLRDAIIPKLREYGLIRCAKLEFEAVQPIAWLELCGFYLDFEQWKDVAEINKVKALALADEIFDELEPVIEQATLFGNAGINLNSVMQVQKYFTLLGIPMPDSSKKTILQPLINEYPLVGKLLEYRELTKASSAFGDSWAEWINPVTGRIHADFLQIGAEDTGRFSCARPNLQQIKRENLYRNCFKAVEGNSLISGDYSQIELRILADLARDKVAIAEFAAGKDFHTATAEQIGRPRTLAKNCNFAIPYGATANRVAATANISMLEADELMRSYFRAFPNFEKWIKKQQRNVLVTHSARTVSGRLMRYIFDSNDWSEKSKAQRNATNGPIQGSSADILKRALRIFYDATMDCRDQIKLVNIVHDEINVEAPDDMVEDISKRLVDSMITAAKDYLNEVEIKVDVKVGRVWSKD